MHSGYLQYKSVTIIHKTDRTKMCTKKYYYFGVTKIKKIIYAKQSTGQIRVYTVRAFRLPPQCKWDIRSCGGPISPIFKVEQSKKNYSWTAWRNILKEQRCQECILSGTRLCGPIKYFRCAVFYKPWPSPIWQLDVLEQPLQIRSDKL